jgi:hypothetical protein
MKSQVQVALLVLGVLMLATTSEAQSPFDTARAHNHVRSSTIEGTWVRRMSVEAQNQSAYPLGNAVAVRNGTTELWFFYAFKPEDGPMISRFESRASGAIVRVTYDPICFYVMGFEDLNPVLGPTPAPTPGPTPVPTPAPTPIPTPTPTPAPVIEYEFIRRTVNLDQANTDEMLTELGNLGFGQCTTYTGGSWFYCMKPKTSIIVKYEWKTWLWMDAQRQQDALLTQVGREGYSNLMIWNGLLRASRPK